MVAQSFFSQYMVAQSFFSQYETSLRNSDRVGRPLRGEVECRLVYTGYMFETIQDIAIVTVESNRNYMLTIKQ